MTECSVLAQNSYFVLDGLVDMYAKCGSTEDAQRMFNKMPFQDLVTWNAMIFGHVKCGQGQKALELFGQMQQEGVQPNSFSFCGGAECMWECSYN